MATNPYAQYQNSKILTASPSYNINVNSAGDAVKILLF